MTTNFNKHDYLSIISSLSSKEEEAVSPKKQRIDEERRRNPDFKENLSGRIEESGSSSVSSLDSFELEFENVVDRLKLE